MTIESGNERYPVVLQVEYPERSSRLLALLGALFFVKAILLIPHIIIRILLGIAHAIVIYIGYWAVLITGRYPRGLFNFGVGVQRRSFRIDAWMNGWTDSYPSFRLDYAFPDQNRLS